MTFSTFELGALAPRVSRVVPVRLAEGGVVMLDLDVDWVGSGVDVRLGARLGGSWVGATLPLKLDHVSFKATLRVRCVLGDRKPFASLIDVAFARKPEVFVKRVVAGPGDVVEVRDGAVFVNGLRLDDANFVGGNRPAYELGPLAVPPGQLFVLGDNRDNSTDSRSFGPVEEDAIVGRAFLKVWPLGDLGFL